MRLAILDLGTNTFHLLISDVSGGRTKQIFKSKLPVKLGEGAIHKNVIGRLPFWRGIRTIKYYREIIDRYKADSIVACATSAIRSSANGKEFVRVANEKTGIKIRTISGSKEAELICYGVRQCINLKGHPALIMDIGGGSTEFIIADDRKIYWKKSFKIGAARLLSRFHPSNPIMPEEIKAVQDYLDVALNPLRIACRKYGIEKLIGSSGSFDTFAEMSGYRFHGKNPIENKNSYRFNMKEFHQLNEIILHSTLADRMKMKGLIRMRVDMIVIASICTEYVLSSCSIKQMYLSKFALKEGILWEEVQRLGKKVKSQSR